MIKCFDCQGDPTHYVIVIFVEPGQDTNYADDYACQRHVTDYVECLGRQDGLELISAEIKRLPIG